MRLNMTLSDSDQKNRIENMRYVYISHSSMCRVPSGRGRSLARHNFVSVVALCNVLLYYPCHTAICHPLFIYVYLVKIHINSLISISELHTCVFADTKND